MSKNVNFIGARNLRKIRVDLGLKQWELECKGAPNISQLETGAKAITEDVAVPALLTKINEIMVERKLTLPYEVSPEILLGKLNIITSDILKRLKKEKIVSIKTIQDIDNSIKELPKEDCINFLNDVLVIVNPKGQANAEVFRKYSTEILKFDLNLNNKVRGYRALIKAYSWLRKYDEVIYLAQSIENEIDMCTDKESKISCLTNIAGAYYNCERYEECLYYLKKLKKLGKYDEFFFMTLQANIFTNKREFEKAEKIYLSVLAKAKEKPDNDYIVNSYSNLGGMYEEMGLEEKAKENIEKAINNIGCGTSKLFIFNANYNGFHIYDKFFSNEINEIDKFFTRAYDLAIELNLPVRLEVLFEKQFNRYLENRQYDKLRNMIGKTEEINIKRESLLKVIKNME